MRSDSLEGKVSLVTGASRGIGRAIAMRLAAGGRWSCLGARDQTRLANVVAEIGAAGGQGVGVALDVTDRGSVDRVFEGILKDHGHIDHVVNNAGITSDALLLRMKNEDWESVLATNLSGVYRCTQAVLRPCSSSARAGS